MTDNDNFEKEAAALAAKKEQRRQEKLKAYVGDRASECLAVCEVEADVDGNLVIEETTIKGATEKDDKKVRRVKVVRRFAKCHPVSSRQTIEGFKAHMKGGNVLCVELPKAQVLQVTAPTGERDEIGLRGKERHVIPLGKAAGTYVRVPSLQEAEDLGSSTVDLFVAIVSHVEAAK